MTEANQDIAFFLSCFEGDAKSVLEQLKEGADANVTVQGFSPLTVAVGGGNVEVVEALLHAGAHVDIAMENGGTPLHVAAEKGDDRVVEALLVAGASVDLAANDGVTALFMAVQSGHAEVVNTLLHAGASVDLAENTGGTPLYVAAQNGCAEVVAALLSAGASVDLARNTGAAPLFIAAEEGHTEVVSTLLCAGASVDLAKNTGSTPLFMAAQDGHTEVVNTLLRAGASVDLTENTGGTPLHIAAQNGHTEVVAALLRAGASVDLAKNTGSTPLFMAAQDGHTEVVNTLLRAGASVDLTENTGGTPLYIAAQNGHAEVVAALLRAGAIVDLAENTGVSPLFIAAQNGHADVVDALLRAGASVDLAENTGGTPLYIAAQKGHDEVVAALLRAEASVDLVENTGATPLYIAAQNGHTDVVDALLRAGACTDLATNTRATPLLIAAQNGHDEVVAALLRAGASVDLVRKDGRTPLIQAVHSGHPDVVASLVSSGANINLADDLGQTPLAAAFHRDRTFIASTLRTAGALVNGHTRSGEASIVAASRNGAVAVLQACLEADDKPDREAMLLALWWAVACGRSHCVELLLSALPADNGLQSNLPNLICLAAHQGYLAVVEAFVAHDAELINAPDGVAGRVAVDYAEARGHNDVVDWLLTQGATATSSTAPEEGVAAFASSVMFSFSDSATERGSAGDAGATIRSGQPQLGIDADVDATIQSGQYDTWTDRTAEGTEGTVPAQMEQLLSQLHSHSDGFVFTHILPTGRLGMGAFGEVSRGLYLGRDVAFKLQKDMDATNVGAGDIDQLRAFVHEARMLAVVAEPTHPHCAGFLGVAVSPDVGIALVTEYVSGGDLCRRLRSHGPFDVVDGLEFLAGLASGLAFLHEAGVVHGDIKPENILLEYEEGDSGRVYGKWIDLGGGYPYWRGRTAYTPRYASPEQLTGDLTHAGSDVFSFACVILEVLSGERPDHPRHASGPPLQRNLSSTPADQGVAEAREKLPDEIRRLLSGELCDCESLVELLVDCWQARVYSRPRTTVVLNTLVEVMALFDAERAAAEKQQPEEAARLPSGNSALLTAAQYRDIDEVKRLVGEGARADEQNRWGHTPLHVAAAVGDPAILNALLSTNPELLEDSFGVTPLGIAEEHASRFGCGHASVRSLCVAVGVTVEDATESGNPQPPHNDAARLQLHHAVAQQDYGAAKLLLDGGADANATNRTGETALHVAARLSASQLIALLIEHGADVNSVESERRRSALFFAADSGGVDAVRLLLDAGAIVDQADKRGYMPLMVAAINSHSEIVAALLGAGAFIDQQSEGGFTALMLAAYGGHVDVVRVLADGHANANATCNDGSTALLYASMKGHTDVVRELLAAGADATLRRSVG